MVNDITVVLSAFVNVVLTILQHSMEHFHANA
jgi:hypothetical protein